MSTYYTEVDKFELAEEFISEVAEGSYYEASPQYSQESVSDIESINSPVVDVEDEYAENVEVFSPQFSAAEEKEDEEISQLAQEETEVPAEEPTVVVVQETEEEAKPPRKVVGRKKTGKKKTGKKTTKTVTKPLNDENVENASNVSLNESVLLSGRKKASFMDQSLNESVMMNVGEFDALFRRMNDMDQSVRMSVGDAKKMSLLLGEDEEVGLLAAFQ